MSARVPSDLLLATGLAFRENIDYLRTIYNKEFLKDIKKDKLSGDVAELVGALDDAPSTANFDKAVDDENFFSTPYLRAFGAYLDEKEKGIHLDFLQLVGQSLKEQRCGLFIPKFATWYNQCLLQKQAAKVLSKALQKSTVKGLKQMYQKYIDGSTGLLKPVTIELIKEPAPDDLVTALRTVAKKICDLARSDTYRRFAVINEETCEQLQIGVLPYARNQRNFFYYARRIPNKDGNYVTDIKKSGYDVMSKFYQSEFSAENIEGFNDALDILELRADYKAFMKKFASFYAKFIHDEADPPINIGHRPRMEADAMMEKYWNADENKAKPIQYAVPDDLRDAVGDVEEEVVSELLDNALTQFLVTDAPVDDHNVPEQATYAYWMDKNDSEDLAVSGYKPFLRFCKSRHLENNLNLYNKLKALEQWDDNYVRYMKKVHEVWEKFLKPSARFSATIDGDTWKDRCKALKRVHTRYWSNEKPRELWSLDPVIRIF